VKCKGCGANLDLTMSECPACGASVELGRLTGILGIVCRACDAYNEPGAKLCASCGKPLGTAAPSPPAPAATAPRPAVPPPPAAPPAPPRAAAPPAPAPPPGSPVVRSFPKAGSGAATRFVPSVLRPSAAKPETPALTPIPLVSVCPRCGAEAGTGRFCSHCGQPLGAKGTQVMMKPIPPGRSGTQVFGRLDPGRAKLVLEAGEGFEGAVFRLNADTVEAGRSKGAVVFPDDPCLAPHHATFFYRAGSLHVRDEGAPGGIFLRLRGISVPLRPGDHFALGDRLLRYAGQVPPSPPPPPDGTRRLGSPRPPPPALVVEEWLEGGAGGRVFVRGGPSVTLGRGGCAVNLGDDPHLSQAHAEIRADASGNVRLKDLGSSNGTYVKIPPHGERELHDGDCVRLGHEVLRVTVA
jgi:pSer/pThr/pTyr-binding forkhead associated (FHA) protein/ribosomal protein L32